MTSFIPGVKLAFGTVTVIPVPPPERVDRDVARTAMLLAPFAVLPVAVVAAGIGALLSHFGAPSVAVGLVIVAVVAVGTKAIHLDGLADCFDALGVPGDRERALDIMKKGDVGPMGAASLVLVVGLQAACLGGIVARPGGWLVATAALAASRSALALACAKGIPAARPGGLGKAVSSTVPWAAAILGGVLWSGLVGLAALSVWPGLATVVALVGAGGFLALVVRRFGGITGDVLGASVEIAAAFVLLALTVSW